MLGDFKEILGNFSEPRAGASLEVVAKAAGESETGEMPEDDRSKCLNCFLRTK